MAGTQISISIETHEVVDDTEGRPIVANNNILLSDKRTQDLIYVPITNSIKNIFGLEEESEGQGEEAEYISEDNDNEQENETTDAKIWNRASTLLLINKIQEAQTRFEREVKKNVWISISKVCSQELGKTITHQQCDAKWKSLKRTYKSILLHNGTSGKNRRHWEYFSAIHSFMFKKPEISPVATCSSRKGMECNTTEQITTPTENIIVHESDDEKKQSESSFSKKRKARMSAAEVRHREKMARQDRFNDLFEKMIEKL